MNLLRRFAPLLLVLALSLVWVVPAYAQENECIDAGGTWSGVDDENGRCTYPAGNAEAVAACGVATVGYRITYMDGQEIKAGCGSGATVRSSMGPALESFTLRLGSERNGWVTFFDNACAKNCTVDWQLPGVAESATLVSPVATMYVRVDGGASAGGYQVCFTNPNGLSHTIYQFIGGVWWPIARSTGATICGQANGDGAFFLGGKP
jgi:hypothetical protein